MMKLPDPTLGETMTLALGIDPGTTTGMALWNPTAFQFMWIESMGIIEAMNRVNAVREMCKSNGGGLELIVVVEDARQRTWFGDMDAREDAAGAGVREGVGSVKRDCRIWEEFLSLREIPFQMRKPAGTKLAAPQFARLTGWQHTTNQHARDAAMVVFQLNSPMIRLKLETYRQGSQQKEPGNVLASKLPAGARVQTRRRPRPKNSR